MDRKGVCPHIDGLAHICALIRGIAHGEGGVIPYE